MNPRQRLGRGLLGLALVLAAADRSGASPYTITVLDGPNVRLFSGSALLNNLGQVAGLSFKDNNSALYQDFLYQNGMMINLNSLLPPDSGWTIKWGLAINDVGQILALADNGSERTVLLTPARLPAPADPHFPALPVPEPSPVFVPGSLMLVLGWRTRRWGGCRSAGRSLP